MALAPCPSCSRHVRSQEPACPFCGAAFAESLVPTSKGRSNVSRAMLVFGGVVALSATIEACGDSPGAQMPAPVPMYGAPNVVEDGGAAVPVPDPAPAPSGTTSATPAPSGSTSDVHDPGPGAVVALYGAPAVPPPPPQAADAGAKGGHPNMGPSSAYGGPPPPHPKDPPKPKKP